ncbi:MAG: LysM peptidoglycan-binding domain-containing protein [Anaerolineae bacterium]|nr:LysM peptidoglycan-binding domain-containing protein [Anaerolineae bacterium]
MNGLQRLLPRLLFVAIAAFVLGLTSPHTGTAQATQTPTSTTPEPQTYVVRTGDTLSRIARQFNVTTTDLARANDIGNPDNIRVGQRLVIPAANATPPAAITPTPTLTANPAPTTTPDSTAAPSGTPITAVVLAGDTLSRFAQRNGTTVQEVVRLNDIANPNLIVAGTRLIIRAEGGTPAPDATTTPPDAPAAPDAYGYGRGISLSITGQDPAQLVQTAISLNVEWVKLDLDWRTLEPQPETYDFAALDTVVFGLSDARLKLLLTLDNTPSWARAAQLEDGPPDDFAVLARFAAVLAERYAGRVAAYQIWNEPNLRREWFSEAHPISADSYAALFTQAQAAIRAADPQALVILAGLAPTGFNDGVNALNDRLYLQALYDLGVAESADGVAVHALGFANPPEARCCQAADGVLTHFENRSFYFRDTLDDYHAIAEANADDRPLWVTRAGWATAEGAPSAPNADFVYATYTDSLEQAAYVVSAFEVAQQMKYVGPMFAYTLNACQTPDARPEACYFSLLDADGLPRAAFNALKAMPR